MIAHNLRLLGDLPGETYCSVCGLRSVHGVGVHTARCSRFSGIVDVERLATGELRISTFDKQSRWARGIKGLRVAARMVENQFRLTQS